MIAHLYRIDNIITGDYYIGKHNGRDQKCSDGSYYWGSGRKIKKQINQYGIENFHYSILVLGEENFIFDIEKRYVTKELVENDNKCLNLTVGGDGISYHSKETREKLSNSFKGRSFSPETRKKISIKNTGKIRTEQTKQLLREKRLEQIFPEEHYENVGKTISSLVWINNGERSKRVKPEILNQFLTTGWSEGRLINYIDNKYREGSRERAKNLWDAAKEQGRTNIKGYKKQ